MKTHITISRKDPSQDVYTQLQENALKIVQHCSGEVWTDYNAHDPGVTILEALNYSLFETDYRLQFDIQDYLTTANNRWSPTQNALFSPAEMCLVNPVTETDYRTLCISSIDELKNIWVFTHKHTAEYTFVLDADPNISESRKQEIRQEVIELYHAHRNLCENLRSVHFITYEPITLCANIDVRDNAPINKLMAQIYFQVEEFFNPAIRFKRIDDLLAEGKSLDEILEGPTQKRMVVDSTSVQERKMELDIFTLHSKLRELPGVVHVHSLALKRGEEVITDKIHIENPLHAFTVPFIGEEAYTVKLYQRGEAVAIKPERVNRLLHNICTTQYGHYAQHSNEALLYDYPESTYRDIFSHAPIWNDMPYCYKKSKELKEYLGFFDKFLSSTLTELQALPEWMRTEGEYLSPKQDAWMNMLENLYNIDSASIGLEKYEGTQEGRIRRAHFLKQTPRWGYERGCSRNLTDFSAESQSGVERYMKGIFNPEKYELEIYLLEHRLFYVNTSETEDAMLENSAIPPSELCAISVILSANNSYLNDNEFRSSCEQILCTRIPAHISLRIYWQEKTALKPFESDYAFWKYLLCTPEKVGLTALTAKLKQQLNDSDYWYSKV